MESVEKLILYQQWMVEFVNNFVSFTRLYDPIASSLIQMGTLIMDGRCFDLTMKVANRAQHKQIVEGSNICVIYLTITRSTNNHSQIMEVAAAVTSGSMARLFVGKTGIFFTPNGDEWDAVICDFVANPVSLIEAVRKPFAQLGEFISKQTERFSKNRFQKIEERIGESVASVGQSLPEDGKLKSDTEKVSSGSLREVMLSGSIAFAAVGSAFAFMTKTLQNVSFFDMLSVTIGLIMLVLAPIILLAILKLHRRNLSVFLEACGWSVNGQMRLSFEMGLLFTREPKLPKEFHHKRIDLLTVLVKQIRIKSHMRLKRALIMILVVLIGLWFGCLVNKEINLADWIISFFSLVVKI